MANIYESGKIAGVWIVEPEIHGDQRGMFIETYRREWFPNGREMVQGNRANRQAGALVGLPYHLHQADYWYVPFGNARVVLHDLREGGPTDGATLQLDLPLLLPEVSDNGDGCIARLEALLLDKIGIEQAHLVPPNGGPARFCLHYDPDVVPLAQVEGTSITTIEGSFF